MPAHETLEIGVGYLRAGFLRDAEQVFRQLLELTPNHIDALHLLGVICLQDGQYEKAIEFIQRAIALNGTKGSFFNNLGLAFKGLGNLEKAIACLSRALELKPDLAETRNNLADFQKEFRKKEEAATCYPNPALLTSPRVAVVTPYFKESPDVLWKCHESVQAQTYPCTHFLIADGHPSDAVQGWPAEHIVLSMSHHDNGNTPRALGSISARNLGYDAIAFLDADNFYYPNHIESMVNLHNQTGASVCTASRSIHRLDGSLMYVDQTDSDGRTHVDTSCMFFTRAAFDLLPIWAMMSSQLSPICDRVMWDSIMVRHISTACNLRPTVAFRTRYQFHYEIAGEPTPPGTITYDESLGKSFSWWESLPEEVKQIKRKLLGQV